MRNAAPLAAGVAVLQYAYALKNGIDISANVRLAQEAKKAMAGSTREFTSVGTRAISAGIVDAVAAVEALDLAALQIAQRERQATATASVGVSIAIAVVAFGVGGIVVGLAMTLVHKRRQIVREIASNGESA